MGGFGLDIHWKIKKRSGDCELSLNIFFGNTMVNQHKKASMLCSFYQLRFDILFALIKI